jgi:AcrR family transcriptional regulator
MEAVMTMRKSISKRERLLTVAGDVFVEKGFRDATVAEICERAGASVSAVNYHFGSKEMLYQEAWRHSFTESLKAYPLSGGISETASAEERLKGLLTATILRIADERNKDFFITQTETVNPTGLLREVMQSELIPMHKNTQAIVRELLGPQATTQDVDFCEICIISMCIQPMILKRIAQRNQENDLPNMIDDIQAFVDYVVRFALAGIKAVKD